MTPHRELIGGAIALGDHAPMISPDEFWFWVTFAAFIAALLATILDRHS